MRRGEGWDTHRGSPAQRADRLATDWPWVRWGRPRHHRDAGLGHRVALIPIDAKLEKGGQHLAQVLRTHTSQVYAAALLPILAAMLLAGFFACSPAWSPKATQAGVSLHRALRWPATKAAMAYLAASDLTRPRLQAPSRTIMARSSRIATAQRCARPRAGRRRRRLGCRRRRERRAPERPAYRQIFAATELHHQITLRHHIGTRSTRAACPADAAPPGTARVPTSPAARPGASAWLTMSGVHSSSSRPRSPVPLPSSSNSRTALLPSRSIPACDYGKAHGRHQPGRRPFPLGQLETLPHNRPPQNAMRVR